MGLTRYTGLRQKPLPQPRVREPAEPFLPGDWGPDDEQATWPDDPEEAFVVGRYQPVDSSWLSAAQYVREEGRLRVWFNDGAMVTVVGVDEDMARGFFNAGSKGEWYWNVVLGDHYKHGHPDTAAMSWE